MDNSSSQDLIFSCDHAILYINGVNNLEKSLQTRADNWPLDKPEFTGRIQIQVRGSAVAFVVDKAISMKDSQTIDGIFLEVLVNQADSDIFQKVLDSSRYFLFRTKNSHNKQITTIGFGFDSRENASNLYESFINHFSNRNLPSNERFELNELFESLKIKGKFEIDNERKYHIRLFDNVTENEIKYKSIPSPY